MKAGDAICNILKREGVEWVIGYPVNHVLEHAAKVDIRPIIVRQERIGLHMADMPAAAKADPTGFVDEVKRVSVNFPALTSIVDARKRPGGNLPRPWCSVTMKPVRASISTFSSVSPRKGLAAIPVRRPAAVHCFAFRLRTWMLRI